MNFRIFSKINTPHGEGVLISVNTPSNGLYVSYDQAKCVVWFGSENPGNEEWSGARWVSKEYYYSELIEYNRDNLRDDVINSLLNC